MPLTLRWVGEDDLDRVARTRTLCFAHGLKDLDRFQKGIREDPRAKAGDFLLAERDGVAVGTSTALSMTMWVRGARIPCQGVAYVGTIKTHRRSAGGEEGVATQLMRETLRKAREREQVVSALMPFRASFYEHFGYGLVERRNEWTLPLTVLPHGTSEGIRVYERDDLEELSRFRQRIVQQGHCDIERPVPAWEWLLKKTETGFLFIDRPHADGPIRGYLWLEHEKIGARDYLRIIEFNYEDIIALKRQLHFLASLRDQYYAVIGAFSADLQLNWLLRETQLPHRPVNHPTAELRPHTRMQVRILDHKRFLEALKLPSDRSGKVVVSVHESEGMESRFALDMSDGHATVIPSSASPAFVCPDRVWAAIACGDLPATRAAHLGLASATNDGDAEAMDLLSGGPAPMCHEYF
jgi:predicted acetyltransferase